MVQEFKTRKARFKVWLGVGIVIVAFIMLALQTGNYLHLLPIFFPVLLLIDELMTKVRIQENGDVWLVRGFSGSIKAYGVMRVVRGRKSWLRGSVTVYYTKGYINIDPEDVDGFIRSLRDYNPQIEYIDKR